MLDVIGTADAAYSSGGSTSQSGSDRIISAIQGQRDRYMKASQDKDIALQAMKQRSEQLEEDLIQLRNENMELFRRLRVLRVNQSQCNSSHSSSQYYSNSSHNGNGNELIDREDPNLLPSQAIHSSKLSGHNSFHSGDVSSHSNSGGIWNVIRSRRFNLTGESAEVDGTAHDPLDEKYMGLYEQDISPFRMQQLDKHLVRIRACLDDS